MSSSVEIGAARVHLIVDAADYDAAIARATNKARGFGTDAEAAFDKSAAGARRSASSLLDYANNLGKTTDQMRILRAAQNGVDGSIIEAAAAAMVNYKNKTEAAASAASKLARARSEAETINTQFDQHRASLAQDGYNAQYAPGLARDAADQARRRADAEQALLPVLQAEEREYQSMLTLAHQINEARDQQRAANAQQSFNAEYAPGLTAKSGDHAAEQRLVVEKLREQARAMDEVEAQTRQTEAATLAYTTQIQAQIDALGKDWYALERIRIAQKGLGPEALASLNALEKQHKEMGRGTISAKQYAFAMRGVPAQITDITTSLAAGQNPLLVFLQQGGQLKDMFGGVGAAAKALGTVLLEMALNPFVIAAAAIVAIGGAAVLAERRLESFQIASARSGGVNGGADTLNATADALDRINNVSLSNADAAVNRLASGGLVLGTNLAVAAEAAARWASITGDKVETVAAKFESLSRDPLKAALELNRSEHFLTEEMVARLQVLTDVGDKQGAVNEVTKQYADFLLGNASQIEAHLGNTSRLLLLIKDGWGNAKVALMDYADSISGVLIDAKKLAALFANPVPGSGIAGFGVAALQNAMNPKQPDFSKVTGGISATAPLVSTDEIERRKREINFLDRKSQYLIGQAKVTEEIRVMSRDALRDGVSQLAVDQRAKEIQAKFNADEAKKNKGSGGGARSAARMAKFESAEQAAILQTQAKQVQASYSLRKISAEDYYKSLRSLAKQEYDLAIASNADQIAAVAGKKGSEQELARLRAANAVEAQKYAQRNIELDTQQAQAVMQLEAAHRQLLYTLQAANQATVESLADDAMRLSMGDKTYAQIKAINDLYRERDKAIEGNRQKLIEDSKYTQEQADADNAAISASIDYRVQKTREGFAAMEAAAQDWRTAGQVAVENWLDNQDTVAEHTSKLVSTSLDGLADSMVGLLQGSKNAWDNYFKNLETMILQFIVRQQLTKWMKSLSEDQNSKDNGTFNMSSIFGNSDSGGGSGGDSGGGSGGGGGWGAFFGGILSMFGGKKNAKGDVYNHSGLSAYRNKIVSTPTYFAKGGVPGMNVMGEMYRPEGILPLARTPNGDLGVRTVGSGGSRGSQNVTINQEFVVQGTMDRSTRDQVRNENGRETQRAMKRNR